MRRMPITRPVVLAVSVLSLVACAKVRAALPTTTDTEESVTIYGVEGRPERPPATCRELGKFEVSRITTAAPAEEDLAAGARELGGNAVGRIKRDHIEDSYLGKVYYFRATALRCPEERPASTSSARTSVSASAPAAMSAPAATSTSASVVPPSASVVPPSTSASQTPASRSAAPVTTSGPQGSSTPARPAGSAPRPR
jgi:hypothetical protein